MMIPRRSLAALLLVAAGTLSGCGWEPLYADHEASVADANLRAIKVSPIAERIGQRLETGLRKSLNPDNDPTPQRYSLNVTMSTGLLSLGVQSQGLGTRGDVDVTANYTLYDIKGGAILTRGSIHTTESFDIQANGYSTVVAQDDAYNRSVEEIRHELVARLTLFLQDAATKKS